MEVNEVKDFLFTWKIENFSKRFSECLGETQPLLSPTFIIESFSNTEYNLQCSQNSTAKYKDCIAIFLHRSDLKSELENVQAQFTFTILAEDATFHISKRVEYHLFEAKGTFGFPNFVKKETIFDNSSIFLPQDTLTVQCYMVRNKTSLNVPKYTEMDANITSLKNDFQQLYVNKKYSDLILQVGDKTFEVHKLILCVRSPVFRAMFKSNMSENNSRIVNITDIDPGTMSLMLEFIYSEAFENLKVEDILKLYSAADKYEILSLRKQCASSLKTFMSEKNFYEILTLADLHQDSDLKLAVQKFVFVYSTKILKSSAWVLFMETNPILAAKTIHEVYMQHTERCSEE